jgi:diguanylate cyclase (GGDEF)-like protein
MAGKTDKFSLISQGLRQKLKVSFYLMSIIPLLVCIYITVRYIFPKSGLRVDILIPIAITVFIACIGFYIVKEVFGRVLSVAAEAKLIAAGDLSRHLKTKEQDEVGDLGDALNLLTQRIRSNMDELKSYSEKTTEINIEIQKRVIILSSLLQISALISQGAKLDDILKITVEKSRLLANSDIAYLFFRREGEDVFSAKVVEGISCGYLVKVTISDEDAVFKKAILANRPLILDAKNPLPDNISAAFYGRFKLKNTIAVPLFLKGRVIAILGVGNTKDNFTYSRDDLELLDIFAKQITIAIENDILMHRVERLEIKDTLTGLYNDSYIRNRLQEEIKRAISYQRPCAFIVVDIDNFKLTHERLGLLQAEATLKRVSSLVRDSVTEIDRVGRTGDDEFAIVLPEKNKRRAQEIAEEIRKKIEFSYSEEPDADRRITVSLGVSENPLDGMTEEELFKVAREFVGLAKRQGRDRTISSK